MAMVNSAATASPELELVITRVFNAPRSLVFQAWTEPRHLLRWSAPRGFDVIEATGDLRVGGTWRAGMRSPDGTEYWLGGVYREIRPDERLVFTHKWDEAQAVETLVTVTLTERDGKTEMDFRQTGFRSAESRDGHAGGWSEAFERLGEHLTVAQGSIAKPA
jgi:uncharacterized protein YndB with AHSA1/START domain